MHRRPTKESVIAKRVFFLIVSFIVTCSTYVNEQNSIEIPEIVFSQMDQEAELMVPEVVRFPASESLNAECQMY